MHIYEFQKLRDIVDAYIAEQKSIGNKLTYQKLSDKMRMQKSYFSKIMSGHALLSRDQAYLLSKELELNSAELEYLNLLIDRDRSGLIDLKSELTKKIERLQIKNTKSEDYLSVEDDEAMLEAKQSYYLEPEVQLVHLSLGILKIQNDPSLLQNYFNLSPEKLSSILKLLESLDLISFKNNKIKLKKSNLHLSKESPFFHNWQVSMKLKATEHVKSLADEDKYSFIASFSGTEEDKEKIRLKFMHFLKSVKKIVEKSEPKNLYQMSFDLFKWL